MNELTLQNAAELYELASSLLSKEPNEEILNALAAMTPSLKQMISEDTAHQLDELISNYHEDKLNVNSLRQEFNELFVSSYSGRYIPPFESAFRATIKSGRQSRPSEAACAEVEAYYFRVGFIPAKLKMDGRIKAFGWSDHIAIELAFLAFLLKTDELQRQIHVDIAHVFLQKHVSTWLANFSNILLQQSLTAYFKFLAHLLGDIVKLNEQFTERPRRNPDNAATEANAERGHR